MAISAIINDRLKLKKLRLHTQQNMSPEEQKTSSADAGKAILIVEDEKPLSHALKLKLSHEGYEVVIAGDGEEGIAQTSLKQFDLILIDIIMPKMDGFTMLSKLKESGNTTTVIVLSNLGQEEDIVKAKELGVKDYMVKSNTPISKIVEVVNAILKT
jgi:DNA-binding response OmpR family regulator